MSKGAAAFFPVSLTIGAFASSSARRDDREAIEKSAALEEAGADVRRIYELRIGSTKKTLADAFFVISTPQDAALSARLRALADRRRFLLCCIDQPRFGFVAMAAIAKAGPVRVAISTAGLAPRVGKALKSALQRAMDERFARFVERLAEQRRDGTRAAHPRAEDSQHTTERMIDAARGFSRRRALCISASGSKRAMPSVEVIAVGTELLLGQLLDTNTPSLRQGWRETGIDVHATHAVGDNRERIAAAIRDGALASRRRDNDGRLRPHGRRSHQRGGLRRARSGHGTLRAGVAADGSDFSPAFGRPMRENNRKQAELPRGSRPLDNPNGTAPGFIAFDSDGKFVACMPGVPREMKPMFLDQCAAVSARALGRRRGDLHARPAHDRNRRVGDRPPYRRTLSQLRESEDRRARARLRADVKLMAKARSAEAAEAMIAPLQSEIERRLAGYVFGRDSETPASAILRLRDRTGACSQSLSRARVADSPPR